jgi:hypothetical protein
MGWQLEGSLRFGVIGGGSRDLGSQASSLQVRLAGILRMESTFGGGEFPCPKSRIVSSTAASLTLQSRSWAAKTSRPNSDLQLRLDPHRRFGDHPGDQQIKLIGCWPTWQSSSSSIPSDPPSASSSLVTSLDRHATSNRRNRFSLVAVWWENNIHKLPSHRRRGVGMVSPSAVFPVLPGLSGRWNVPSFASPFLLVLRKLFSQFKLLHFYVRNSGNSYLRVSVGLDLPCCKRDGSCSPCVVRISVCPLFTLYHSLLGIQGSACTPMRAPMWTLM